MPRMIKQIQKYIFLKNGHKTLPLIRIMCIFALQIV